MPGPGRRRRRRRSHRAAWLAAVVYGGLALVAFLLVSGALRAPSVGGTAEETGGSSFGETFAGPEQLALRSVGARAQRSTVGVAGGTGFVAWEANGLTLVVTARPAGGWRTEAARAVEVSYGAATWEGTLARTDPASGLGLVRVPATGIAEPLWEEPRTARLSAGDLVVVVGRRSADPVEAARVGARRIYLGTAGLGSRAGSPVLDEGGRLVGVIDAGGAAVPIARACGVIRRC